jgi:hypothetical protein
MYLETMSLSPDAIAEHGKRLYAEKYRADYERRYFGQYAAIDVESGEAFVADRPETATANAERAGRAGPLYLLRIGHAGVYHLSRTHTHGKPLF